MFSKSCFICLDIHRRKRKKNITVANDNMYAFASQCTKHQNNDSRSLRNNSIDQNTTSEEPNDVEGPQILIHQTMNQTKSPFTNI